MTRKCRQCRWCRRSFPLKVEVKKKGCAPSLAHMSLWTMSRRDGMVEGLHHLHHRHCHMCAGGTGCRPFNPDLLPCKYEFRFVRAVVSKPPESRRNGLRCSLDILEESWAVFLVIIVSPCRNFTKFSKSSRKISSMFSFPRIQLCTGGIL